MSSAFSSASSDHSPWPPGGCLAHRLPAEVRTEPAGAIPRLGLVDHLEAGGLRSRVEPEPHAALHPERPVVARAVAGEQVALEKRRLVLARADHRLEPF